MGTPFETELTFGTSIAAGEDVTPISSRTTVPTDLTEISLDEWTKDDASYKVSIDGEL